MSSTFTPRLATSRQWTELPADFLSKVLLVFDNQFKFETTKGEFIVDGRIYPEEVIVRVGYLEHGRLKQINFEASMDLTKAKQASGEDDVDATAAETRSKTMELLYVCIDSLGSLMEEYFQLPADGDEKEELDVPDTWRAYEFEGDTVYLQHSTLNTKLEDEADRLLGVGEKKLFNEQGEATDEDALKNAEIDADLAFEIQQLIRAGKYPIPEGSAPDAEDELN